MWKRVVDIAPDRMKYVFLYSACTRSRADERLNHHNAGDCPTCRRGGDKNAPMKRKADEGGTSRTGPSKSRKTL
ncbi:hypothetical protein SeLEV6574_g06111 [Synchytrium endobioticum]|uniref:Uncharacterized protein n=1 Tax=Synchytrium endobioticum TaxID=286115 RepID=A0A507CQJ2_9FUNG|nr:hypothetical protein SeLEV6574_g06111 [Synchytrium endobioticum]